MSAGPDFRDALLAPARAVPEGLVDGAGRPAGRRFNVYRNNVAVALTEALAAGFPATRKLLGAARFRAVAGAYLRQHQPSEPRMMRYGAGFPAFLDGDAALARHPYLGDVARLEYALRESYHAADPAPLEPAAMAVAPDELLALRPALAPPVRLLRARWPVFDLWAFTMAGGPRPARSAPQDVIVLRAGFDPAPHPLPPGGLAFLHHLTGDKPLSTAIRAALAEAPDFDLAALLTLLLSHDALEGPAPT
jgi:hypothetical protein